MTRTEKSIITDLAIQMDMYHRLATANLTAGNTAKGLAYDAKRRAIRDELERAEGLID